MFGQVTVVGWVFPPDMLAQQIRITEVNGRRQPLLSRTVFEEMNCHAKYHGMTGVLYVCTLFFTLFRIC